jgi:hypothetical protein
MECIYRLPQLDGTRAPSLTPSMFPYSHSILKSILRKLTGYSITPFEATLVPQFLLNNGELPVGKEEDWLYTAGELRAARQFSTPSLRSCFRCSMFILIDLSSL